MNEESGDGDARVEGDDEEDDEKKASRKRN